MTLVALPTAMVISGHTTECATLCQPYESVCCQSSWGDVAQPPRLWKTYVTCEGCLLFTGYRAGCGVVKVIPKAVADSLAPAPWGALFPLPQKLMQFSI